MQREPHRFQQFSGDGIYGEIAASLCPSDVVGELSRIIDPSAATETIHWGRNYLYTAQLQATGGPVEVVVKQFRNQGIRRRLERRFRGSKAQRSWRVAKELLRVGLLTPEPVALVESVRPDGPSFFITGRLDDAHEVRHFFRRLNSEPEPGEFPAVEELAFLVQLGRYARALHDAGIVDRDLSIGNILAVGKGPEPKLWLVDINRARIGQRPGTWRRTRDICRLPVLETEHRRAFLEGYWGGTPSRWSPQWWLYALSVDGYIAKHRLKGALRGLLRRKNTTPRGGHHDHIPAARRGASSRDRSVWDHLSDQPHQHAGKWVKRWIRLMDSPHHLRELATIAVSAPKIAAGYRRLKRDLHSSPAVFDGIGVCLRPWPDDPAAHLEAFSELGIDKVLLRLHPWQESHDAEEELARELHKRGCDIVFALPQIRELVTDVERWRDAVAEIGDRFAPYGRQFQIGQAVNRSKWGIWSRSEYIRLFRTAAGALRQIDGVELLGPAVIDFELQITAALANARARDLDFDVLSSLLYVDRRGAPENRQMGFDTIDKVLLLKAIAETGRNTGDRSWITEVNWPLWEGPHSPAGRSVSVDEEQQADYLVRYYLLTLASGAAERVYWWRLVARGYGLVAPEPDGVLRRRASWRAMKTMVEQIGGATFRRALPAPDGVWLYLFDRAGESVLVAWGIHERERVHLPATVTTATTRDGVEIPPPDGDAIAPGPSPVYYVLDQSPGASGAREREV